MRAQRLVHPCCDMMNSKLRGRGKTILQFSIRNGNKRRSQRDSNSDKVVSVHFEFVASVWPSPPPLSTHVPPLARKVKSLPFARACLGECKCWRTKIKPAIFAALGRCTKIKSTTGRRFSSFRIFQFLRVTADSANFEMNLRRRGAQKLSRVLRLLLVLSLTQWSATE